MQIEEQEDDIYHSKVELQAAIRCLSQMENGGRAVEFLQHLIAKGLEPNGVLKYADSMSRILQERGLENSTKKDIESFIAKINTSKLKSWTKRNYRLTVKKLFQCLKYGDTSRNIQYPAEVAWIRPHPSKKEIDESSRVGPDKLLGPASNDSGPGGIRTLAGFKPEIARLESPGFPSRQSGSFSNNGPAFPA